MNELRLLHPIFRIVQRIEHIKVYNYIENIVSNYNRFHIDFIMHFRLSRRIAYQLIDQFSVSEIFTSIQGIYYFLILDKNKTLKFILLIKFLICVCILFIFLYFFQIVYKTEK